MPDDSPMSPVQPIGTEPVEPAHPPARVPELASAAPASAPDAASLRGLRRTDPTIGSVAAHDAVERPPHAPASVVERATVHDAAAHGNAIASAIEHANAGDPTSRAHQLGGAAASAASGQATPAKPVSLDDDEQLTEDRLAPIDAIDEDPRRRDRRSREEREYDADIRP